VNQEDEQGSQGSGVQVIERAAKILRALERNPQGMSLAMISKEVGIPRPTVQRIVSGLAAERLVISGVGNTGARLGPGLVSLGLAARSLVHAIIKPHLVSLSAHFNETVDLSIRDGRVAVLVESVSEWRRLRADSAIGQTFPLHSCANGKALLASMSDEHVAQLLPELELKAYTANTITSKKKLLAELDKIREEGVAYDREEHTMGISAVGVYLSDPAEGQMAISVPVPTVRFFGNESFLKSELLACRDEALALLSHGSS
jgi:DNA-binding IclR family transcriptional regulator